MQNALIAVTCSEATLHVILVTIASLLGARLFGVIWHCDMDVVCLRLSDWTACSGLGTASSRQSG